MIATVRSSIVVDASTAIGWSLADEQNGYCLQAARHIKENGGLVPALWCWEVQNSLLMSIKRNRIDDRSAAKAIGLLAGIPISIDPPAMFGAEFALARQYDLTIYDAAYLELAMRRGCKLATVDKALAKAAQTAGVFWSA